MSPCAICSLSLHDALPILSAVRAERRADLELCRRCGPAERQQSPGRLASHLQGLFPAADRKSTRLNSSHLVISYAVFCLKKKKLSKELHGDVEKNLKPVG